MVTSRGWRRAAAAIVSAGTLALGFLIAPSSLAEPTESAAPRSDSSSSAPQVLFVADAPRARISRSSGEVRLSLPAQTPITWFSDRPDRHTGRTNLRQLVTTWSAVGFDSDPPNAALVMTDRRGRERIHVVTLSEPRRVGSWIHITVTPVDEDTEAGYAHIHGLKADRYVRAQMFIDDAANPPCSRLITTATNCIMTEQPVALRSMSGVGTVSACGIETEDVQWQIQASFAAVDAGRIVQDGPLFANGRQIPDCDTPERGVVTVFPSASAVTYTQMTLTNQSFVAGESTMGPGGVPSNPSWSPILITYTIAAE